VWEVSTVTLLDVSRWPADASGYITRTADALRAAGVNRSDVARFVMSFGGARTISPIIDGCVAELRKFYEVREA
jgi:hypothetical protein